MHALFYDTETTGFPDNRAPAHAAHQPHIVQLGAALVDLDTRKTIASIDVIVKPQGWTIPTEVSKIHGITTEHASDVGISEEQAVQMLFDLWAGRTRIGHNEQFDARILNTAIKRYLDPGLQGQPKQPSQEWEEASVYAHCTAVMATPILNLPPTERMLVAGRNHPKTPNLGEAYRHFTGRELVGAHSAMVDVQACMDVYFAIKQAQE